MTVTDLGTTGQLLRLAYWLSGLGLIRFMNRNEPKFCWISLWALLFGPIGWTVIGLLLLFRGKIENPVFQQMLFIPAALPWVILGFWFINL